MPAASFADLAARYAQLDQLIERACAAARARDSAAAILLGCAVAQKLTTLDERLLEMGILP